eukprot:TRINITY_DN38808_c0_g1_i1.p1 TRINITY_DN38808_c0_g1~~TRINITY_DN38808_c0_g1_i1.p1  ORF type:complete len:646 (+),score=139.14 TRINITY_DN38808_c0_g1_i1:37-1938(+)
MASNYSNVNRVKVFGVGLAGVVYAKDLRHVAGTACLAAFGEEENEAQAKDGFHFFSPEMMKVIEQPNPFKKIDPRFLEPSDVWSLSAMAYMCLTGRPPFTGVLTDEVRHKILTGKYDCPTQTASGISPEGVELLDQGLRRNPKSRPKAETMVLNSWVMSQALEGKERAMEGIVDRLQYFAEQPGVMQALGKFLKGLVHKEKMDMLLDLYGFVDIRGDGDLRRNELVHIVANRRADINKVFYKIDNDSCPGISREEFLQANMFAEGVLSERLITEVFRTIDRDQSGVVTAAEFYESLAHVHHELTIEETAEWLMMGADEWDNSFTLKEFTKLFPPCKGVAAALEKKRRRFHAGHRGTTDTAHTYFHSVSSWAKGIHKLEVKLRKIGGENEIGDLGGSAQLVKSTEALLKDLRTTLGKPPKLSLSDSAKDFLGVDTKSIQNKVSIDAATGVTALDLIIRKKDTAWLATLTEIDHRLRRMKTIDPDSRHGQEERTQGLDDVLESLERLCSTITGWTSRYASEQKVMLQAAGELEAHIPELTWSMRGRAHVKASSEVEEMIQHYQRLSMQTTAKATRLVTKVQSDKAHSTATAVTHADVSQPVTVGMVVKKLSDAMATRYPALRRFVGETPNDDMFG